MSIKNVEVAAKAVITNEDCDREEKKSEDEEKGEDDEMFCFINVIKERLTNDCNKHIMN